MSNPHAIAAATATFRQLLIGAAGEPTLTGADVTIGPPDLARAAGDTGRKLNLFLYQVTPNAAWRNQDLPFRNGNGDFVRQPVLAVNLAYLVTAYGEDDDELDAQHLLGHAMSLVHDRSVLTREMVAAAVLAYAANEAVANSDLADQVERVKLTPLPLTQEELFKLWTAFQTHYRLSVAYEASVILVERPKPRRAALPVRRAGLTVAPIRRPTIEGVAPDPAGAGATLTITGRNLRADTVKVRFGDTLVDPAAVDDTAVVVTLPAGLSAGVNAAQVLHELQLGDPPAPHRGVESNAAPFVLRPAIETAPPITVAAGSTLTLAVAPPVARAQKAALLVGEDEIPIPPRPSGSPPASMLDFPIPNTFPTGTYLLRLRIDGAESALEADPATGAYVGPELQIT